MIKLLILLNAYLLASIIDPLPNNQYYFTMCWLYCLVALLCALAHLDNKSPLLLCYATANIITATGCFLVNFGLYGMLKGLIWYNPLNLSLILEAFELMLLCSGGASVFTYIINHFITNSIKRKGSSYSMVNIK